MTFILYMHWHCVEWFVTFETSTFGPQNFLPFPPFLCVEVCIYVQKFVKFKVDFELKSEYSNPKG